MNTFGKTLVILNLVAAVAVAAVAAAVYVTRTNWKDYADHLKDEVIVAQRHKEPLLAVVKNSDMEAKAAIAARNTALKTLKEREDKFKDDLEELNAKILAEQNRADLASLNKDRIGEENNRLRLENQGITKALEASEQSKLALQKQVNDNHKQAEIFRNQRDTFAEQNKNMLDKIRGLEKTLAEASSRPGAGATFTAVNITKNPNDINPPSSKVRGTVEKVFRDAEAGVLVQLSIGVDLGVQKNNTMDVYRTSPRAEYLGVVRIIESTAQKSVGRLIRSASNSQLKEGDLVVGNLAAP